MSVNLNINNLNANKINANAKKAEANAQLSGTGFEALFTSAMNQASGPQSKLNGINTELQEALGKNKKKADNPTPPEAVAMSGSTLAQAQLWQQRDWANTPVKAPEPSRVASAEPSRTAATSTASPSASSGASPEAKPANTETNAASSNTAAPANTNASGTNTANNNAGSESNATASPAGATSTTEQTATASSAPGAATDPLAQMASGDGSQISTPLGGDATAVNTTTGNSTPMQANYTVVASDASQVNGGQATDLQTTGAKSDVANNTLGDAATAASTSADPKAAANNTPAQPIVAARVDNNNPALAAQQLGQQAAQLGGKAQAANGQTGRQVGDEILATTGTQSAGTGSEVGLAQFATGRTGSAAQATIKTPVNQPGFVKELGAQVQWAVGKNLSTVDIRLPGDQLGSMNMRLVQRGQEVSLTLRTQDDATAQALQQTVANLKESLAQSGLQLTNVTIQSPSSNTSANNSNNPNFAQQFGEPSREGQAQGQQGQQGRGQGGNGGKPDAAEQVSAQTPPRARSNGNIDLLA